MPPPNTAPERTQQRQRQREYSRLRLQLLAAWKELERRCEELTLGQPRRVSYFVWACVKLWKRRGSTHLELFLGPAALRSVTTPAGRPVQSHSSHKRAKPQVLDAWEDAAGKALEGLGLLRRTHRGGGRLAKDEGGGKNAQGRFRGNADGVMPGPEITGWPAENYRTLKLGPPPSPAPAQPGRRPDEEETTYHERVAREAALAARGLQMSDGP